MPIHDSVQLVEIDKIRFDPATQARVAISQESLREYIEAYKAGDTFPNIVCYYDRINREYWIADGFHRVLAAKEAGHTEIAVEVHLGDKNDAKWHAAGANVKHGIRRTNADKRKAVEFALSVHPEYANNNIAKHVGVAQTFVADVRRQVESDSTSTNSIDSINNVEKRVGTDGKEYPVKRNYPPPPPDPMDDIPDAPRQAPPPPAKPIPVLDEIGNEVPAHCMPLWGRRQEAQDILTMVSRLRSMIEKAKETKDPLWAEVHIDGAEAEVSTLYNTLAQLKPYAVCAYCGGVQTANCRACKGRGVMSRHFFNSLTTKEAREHALRMGERNKASAA